LIVGKSTFSFWEEHQIISFIMFVHVLEKTRANNSGFTNHRVICLVVIGSSFDNEQVFQVSNEYL
jgi:hypothetical protein